MPKGIPRTKKHSKKYRKQRKEREQLQKKLEKSRYPETQRIKRLLKSKANQMRKELQKEILSTEKHIINNLDANPKIFYHHINNKKNSRSPILPILDPVTEEAIADPETAAALLADQYESVFTEPEALPPSCDTPPTPCIDTIDITTERFKRALRSSKNNTSAGPDNIPSMVLKQGADTLAEPLAMLWSKSFEEEEIPSIHLKGIIAPVKKKGKKLPKNFRPVVLLTNFSKAFERVLVE